MPGPTKQPHSTIATWAATIVRALDAQDLPGAAIAARAGIDEATLRDPDGRVPRGALSRLWELAIEESGDPAFGLLAARHTLQTTFHALGYAVLASSTQREAMERVIRYRRVLGDIMKLSLEDDGDRTRFVIDVSSEVLPWASVDALIAVMARQTRMLHGGRDVRPLGISMRRPTPDDRAPYERLLKAPLRFEQRENFLEYARSDCDRPLPAANAELARQNDDVVVRYLARLSGSGVLARTRQSLLEELPNGAPTKQQIAARLGMSPRNLQRLLANEDTSFKQLLEEARLTLARNYLEEGRLPITEIAFLLGFADTSAFSRAFKRWTGTSPRDFSRRGAAS